MVCYNQRIAGADRLTRTATTGTKRGALVILPFSVMVQRGLYYDSFCLVDIIIAIIGTGQTAKC